MWVLWLIVIFLLTVLEVSTVNLVSVWFIASALGSLICSFFINSFYLQFAIFVCLGLVLMLITRPILVKKLKKNTEETNANRVIGMKALVTEDIKKNSIGEVKVDGKRWSAISKEEFRSGDYVIVDAIEGVKLVVRKDE